jgi:succinyl-CoA synthetase beta subunit
MTFSKARAEGRTTLTEPESKAFLKELGIPTPASLQISAPEEAPKALETIGAPVAIKLISSAITHKTEIGGVIFPIDTAEAATQACHRIAANLRTHRPDAPLDGFLIEAYRPAQPEWLLSLRNDPLYGPAILFGLGGIYVEILKQITVRLAPLAPADIEALISETPATQILRGVRGAPPANLAALRQMIQALSDLTKTPDILAQISEIEINPLTVTAHGVLALDALIVLRP